MGQGGDEMIYSNSMQFSTFDSDSDLSSGSCVTEH